MAYLLYDDKNMWDRAATRKEWLALQPTLRNAHADVEKRRADGEHGFFDVPFERDSVRVVKEVAAHARKRFTRMLVIGIGGSDLGARTLIQSLAVPGKGLVMTFIGNPDPDILAPILKNNAAWWKQTALCVVSKSGTTLETMSMFFTLRQALLKAVGAKKHVAHVYVITDPNQNVLHALADEFGYALIPHPLNVGGRFSVLSTVGLFPAACAGIDIHGLLKGAKSMETARRRDREKSLPARFAGLHYLAYTKHDQHIHVFMPYASRLGECAFWYRQLWAESLGKKKGNTFIGPTPIAAFGAADQHSQIQLYNEGPNNKVLTFLRVNRFTTQVTVPSLGSGMSAFAAMSGLSLERLMHAELQGTAEALAQAGRPNGTLTVNAITPESVGALLMFYELATAYMAELLGVDAYNQPGVEAGKRHAKDFLANV